MLIVLLEALTLNYGIGRLAEETLFERQFDYRSVPLSLCEGRNNGYFAFISFSLFKFVYLRFLLLCAASIPPFKPEGANNYKG